MNAEVSRLIQLSETARRPSRWWLAWLVTMVIIVVIPPLGIALGNAVLGAPAPTSPWYPYVGAFGSVATLLALFVWVRGKEGRPFATVGFRPNRGWVRLLAGFGIGAGMISAAVGLGLLAGVYGSGRSTHPLSGAEAVLPLLPLILLFVLQALCQVALVPGYLLQMSLRQLPSALSIIATSALVAVLHALDPVTMLNLFLFAIFAALVFLQQGSLWLVAGIQGGWSCFQAGIFGLPVGGITAPAALFSIGATPGAPAAVGGGQFGVGSGLLITGILAGSILVASIALRRTARSASEGSSTPGPAHTTPKGKTHVAQHDGRQVQQPPQARSRQCRGTAAGLDHDSEDPGRSGAGRP